MSYVVRVFWRKKPHEAYLDKKYSRAHTWSFDGGIEIEASSSPRVVPLPMSNESAVDPEEAFVAALSSCHMLSFLAIAAEHGYVVESYEDNAEGVLRKNDQGKLAMTKVTLKPHVTFGGDDIPSSDQVDKLHHLAHEVCFIANSVGTEIAIVPT